MKIHNKTLLAAMAASLCVAAPGLQAAILIDYDDGVANGVHDAAVNNGGFETEPVPFDPTEGFNYVSAGPWIPLSAFGKIAIRSDETSPVGGNNMVTGQGGTETSGRNNGLDTGHTLAVGDIFTASFDWLDLFGWDTGESIDMVLYYTDTDAIGGARTVLHTFNSGSEVTNEAWESETFGPTAALADAGADGKSLFVSIEPVGLNTGAGSFARVDNVFLEVVPEPGSLALLGLGGLLIARRRRG